MNKTWVRISEGTGWDGGGHEGHYVPLMGIDEGGGYIRFLEAQQPEVALVRPIILDADDVRAQVFQIGCACGWRSRRLYTPISATWNPETMGFELLAAEDNEAGAIWLRHLDESKITLAHLVPYRG